VGYGRGARRAGGDGAGAHPAASRAAVPVRCARRPVSGLAFATSPCLPADPKIPPNYVTGGHRLARHRTPAGVGSHRQRRDDQTPTFPRAPAPPRSRPLHPLVPPPRPGPDAKLPQVNGCRLAQTD